MPCPPMPAEPTSEQSSACGGAAGLGDLRDSAQVRLLWTRVAKGGMGLGKRPFPVFSGTPASMLPGPGTGTLVTDTDTPSRSTGEGPPSGIRCRHQHGGAWAGEKRGGPCDCGQRGRQPFEDAQKLPRPAWQVKMEV